MPSIDPRRATIFGQYAESYGSWRPAYPSDAVDRLVPACQQLGRETVPIRHEALCFRWVPQMAS